MTPITRFTKHAAAILDYPVDWSKWLATDCDSIGYASWIVPAGIVKTNAFSTSTTATIWLEQGVPGKVYPITCVIETVQHRTETYTFEIAVI